MTNVNVVIGAGSIGQAIARRVSAGKHVVLADLRRENADMAATALGEVSGVIHAAGVSPSQASPETVFKVDLTAPPSCWKNSAMSSRVGAMA